LESVDSAVPFRLIVVVLPAVTGWNTRSVPLKFVTDTVPGAVIVDVPPSGPKTV
jgi:hypothetical protein